MAQIYIAHCDVAYETSWCSYDYICTHFHRLVFLVITVTIISTINSHRINLGHIVSEALHCLVNLLCQFTCWAHDNTINLVLGITSVVKH